MIRYLINDKVTFDCGFNLSTAQVAESVVETNRTLARLPKVLYSSIDLKATSGVVGAVFANSIAQISDGIINPIEKGHPDVLPAAASTASESQLRNYPQGLEIKCTLGNVLLGSALKTGASRIEKLCGLTWQAHHREVRKLMGVVWDFLSEDDNESMTPHITGVFYSAELVEDDWGVISGTTGRNTKVTGMRSSGRRKMAAGWTCMTDDARFVKKYMSLLSASDLVASVPSTSASDVEQIVQSAKQV